MELIAFDITDLRGADYVDGFSGRSLCWGSGNLSALICLKRKRRGREGGREERKGGKEEGRREGRERGLLHCKTNDF